MKTGNIVKAKFTDEFVRIHNSIARNPKMSMKEKGLLLIIMSLPENWTLHISQLPAFCGEGKTAVRNAFKSLKEKGFIIEVEMRASDGRFNGKNYMAYYESQTIEEFMVKRSTTKADSPLAGFRDADKRDADNRTLQRKNVTLNKKKENKKEKKEKEQLDFSFFLFKLKQGQRIPKTEVPNHLLNEFNSSTEVLYNQEESYYFMLPF